MKYAALEDYLKALPATKERITLRFDEIEKIIGAKLPKSASTYREWWANQQGGSGAPHWRAAGFAVDRVQLGRHLVEFQRIGAPKAMKAASAKQSAAAPPDAIDESVLLNAGFRRIANWELTDDGRITLVGEVPGDPATYAHVVNGKVYYIGSATMGLKKRVYFYGRPGKTQRTSIRVNGLIKELLERGNKVELIAAFPGPTTWNGLPVDVVTGLETGLVKHSPPWNKRGVAG